MPTVSTVNAPVSNTSELYAGANLTGTNATLNQNDFLKLLVAQIQFQDPLNPKSNTDMAAQMAQFTSLSQASETSSSLAMIQANSLIGTSVTVQLDGTHSTSGSVSGVTVVNGKPQIVVNGQHYNVSQVTSVWPAPPPSPPGSTGGTETAAPPQSAPPIYTDSVGMN
jgi:flagellar basal-body rod modification protein FlgD